MFRDPILGYDTGHTGAAGTLRGLAFWNMDLSIRKTINVTERVGLEFQTVFTNVLNHVQLGDPFLEIQDSADWVCWAVPELRPKPTVFAFDVRNEVSHSP
jgi:hypothetical protein